ncbi:hypothetical protein [Sphingobacterium sp.]|uniref:hypothetical protein n=1 Tax=Sphingobacterium sp. TaxID=341027 RepID=UPI002896B74A|nr:hypothetical protein [Sphingobacterium sp.]
MYYNIELEADPKVIGVHNGVYQVQLDEKAYDKEKYKLLDEIFLSNEFTADQVIPELDFKFYFKILKSAKKTSFMSYSPNIRHGQFLINKNTIEVFESFNIQKYKNFDAIIYDSKKEDFDNSYSLFYCVLQDWNVIDFNRTIFTTGGVFGNGPIVEHKFANENEYKALVGSKDVKTLALTEKFDTSLDFFITRVGGLFVSERLKEAIERNKLSGVFFRNNTEVITSN